MQNRQPLVAQIIAQLADLQLNPQQLGKVSRVTWAAYKGNYAPAIALAMEQLTARRPSAAAQVASTAQKVVDEHAHQKMAFFRRFTSQTYGVYLILGGRGTGKTALALRLAQILDRDTYAIGIPSSVAPKGLNTMLMTDIASVPKHSVVIIDDASLYASSADARSAPMLALQGLINICRHVDVTLLITGQQAASLYKYVMDADGLFLKPPGLLFKEFERAEVAKLMALAAQAFAGIPLHKKTKRLRSVYVVAPEYVGLMEFDKPEHFPLSLSKNKDYRVLDAEFRTVEPGPDDTEEEDS